MYGWWIGPTGAEIPVYSRCGHQFIVPYTQAHEEGWIAVIDEAGFDETDEAIRIFGARIFDNVGTEALSKLRQMVQKSKKHCFSIEDLPSCERSPAAVSDDPLQNKRLAVQWINRLIRAREVAQPH